MKPNTTQLPPVSPPPIFPSTAQPLSTRRMGWAMGIAIAADTIQLCLGPIGWAGLDEVIDIIAMVITVRLLGFHWVLLPTFALEFIPGAGMFPTWTLCVAYVIRLRKKKQEERNAQPPTVIDV